MSTGRTSTASPRADELLSRLYQQVTEQQAARIGSGYDIEAGLDRYRTWLRDQPAGDDKAAGNDQAGGSDQAAWDDQDADRVILALYGVHYQPLVRLAMLLVHDPPTAEEGVQDSFVALHAGLHRLKNPDKALAYLRAAVINRSRLVLRHRNVVDKHAPKPMPDLPVTGPEQLILTLLDRSDVLSVLRNLPARQREVVVLRYYADLSEAQIATAMGISRGAVKSHTGRAMSTLRAKLEKPYG